MRQPPPWADAGAMLAIASVKDAKAATRCFIEKPDSQISRMPYSMHSNVARFRYEKPADEGGRFGFVESDRAP